MAAPKRQKMDSIAGKVAIVQSLEISLEAPEKLSDQERFFFDVFTSSREKTTWSPTELHHACRYAKESLRIEQFEKIVDAEGLMIEVNGKVVPHPALAAIHQSTNQLQSITRLVGLAAASRGLSGPDQRKRNDAELKLINQIDTGEDLL